METQTFVAKLSHLGDLSIQKKMKQCSFHILTVLATTCGVKKKTAANSSLMPHFRLIQIRKSEFFICRNVTKSIESNLTMLHAMKTIWLTAVIEEGAGWH